MNAWDTNDQTVATFFDRLAAGVFPGKIPEAFKAFRHQCERRELAGRDVFGRAYLERENLAEAREEACDLALYAFLDSLQAIRDGHGDDDYELVLTMAMHAYRAYAVSLQLRAKRRGAP